MGLPERQGMGRLWLPLGLALTESRKDIDMDKFKQLIIEHKKATLIALFFLIVFIGGSAVSAINVAKHRAEQEQTEQDAPITEVVDKGESDKEVTLTDTQKKAIKNYDDDTKGFIETLSASIWSADGGRYTLRFSDNSYVETANGKSSVHSYAPVSTGRGMVMVGAFSPSSLRRIPAPISSHTSMERVPLYMMEIPARAIPPSSRQSKALRCSQKKTRLINGQNP